jgi:hypothetical protein
MAPKNSAEEPKNMPVDDALKSSIMSPMREVGFDSLVFREGKTYVAHCPELDVSSCGVSVAQARKMLLAAVRLFLEEAEKLGTLDTILREAGYRSHRARWGTHWEPPDIVATERATVEV